MEAAPAPAASEARCCAAPNSYELEPKKHGIALLDAMPSEMTRARKRNVRAELRAMLGVGKAHFQSSGGPGGGLCRESQQVPWSKEPAK